MAALMIFVVGFAHSGTTFLCEVLHGVGYRFSPQLDHMEDMKLRHLLFDVDRWLWRGATTQVCVERFGRRIRDRFLAFGEINVVKQPSFVHCLPVVIGAGLRPERVLIAQRDLATIRRSLLAYGSYERGSALRRLKLAWMEKEWASLVNFLAAERMEGGIVRFPRSVEDPDEIPNALGVPSAERGAWRDAWGRCRKPDRVHFGA